MNVTEQDPGIALVVRDVARTAAGRLEATPIFRIMARLTLPCLPGQEMRAGSTLTTIEAVALHILGRWPNRLSMTAAGAAASVQSTANAVRIQHERGSATFGDVKRRARFLQKDTPTDAILIPFTECHSSYVSSRQDFYLCTIKQSVKMNSSSICA